MDFCHNPIKKETNLLSLFKNFPDHYTAVAVGYSSKVFFKGYNFQYLSSQPLILSQMPIKYCPKYFILIHPYLGSFLFVCIWNGADILFTRDHSKVSSLIDWHYQAVRQTL